MTKTLNAILFKFIAIFYFAIPLVGLSQSLEPTAPVVQPTIMVIPFSPQNISLRLKYEQDELARIAVTKVKEGFDNRGVSTIDLRAKLKQANNNEALQEDQASELKDEIISLSGADVFVEVEANRNPSTTGNSVTIIITAYDVFSGESLANKVSNSPKFYTSDYEKLVSKAVDTEIDNFLNVINEKFIDIGKNGRTIALNLGISQEATIDFDSEFGDSGDLLSDLIEDYIRVNAHNNYYHLQGISSNKMIFDLVKIPLKNVDGSNFRISKFAASLRNYLKKLGIDSDRTIVGNSITITIS